MSQVYQKPVTGVIVIGNNIDDNMFYNVFESYLTDWFKSYKGYKYTIYQNEVQSFIDNLEIEFKAIEE